MAPSTPVREAGIPASKKAGLSPESVKEIPSVPEPEILKEKEGSSASEAKPAESGGNDSQPPSAVQSSTVMGKIAKVTQ